MVKHHFHLRLLLGNESLVDLLLDHETTDPSTVLGSGNGNALCTVLSTFYESRWTYAKRLQLVNIKKIFYKIIFYLYFRLNVSGKKS